MKIKAIYENNVLKPIGELDLPNKARVSITIQESFSDLLDELGEPEAREDVSICRPERDAVDLRLMASLPGPWMFRQLEHGPNWRKCIFRKPYSLTNR